MSYQPEMTETTGPVTIADELESPGIRALIRLVERDIRWTGRPGYPVRTMVGIVLVRLRFGLGTWTQALAAVADDDELRSVIGCVPSQWACYRFSRTLAALEVSP